MRRIKNGLWGLFLFSLLLQVVSCGKAKDPVLIVTPKYSNRVAQDSTFRKGKWYSITTDTTFGNGVLDTIWFLPDSMAGWTGFVPSNKSAYAFRKTYFKDIYHIVYLAQDPLDTIKIDTIVLNCGMTPTQDTFTIFWHDYWGSYPENYLKLK